ncbi:MAG: ABC transporter permease [Planctomycetes bacterium]|nr:ABC transporter permease [Planctomycetota bacterium]
MYKYFLSWRYMRARRTNLIGVVGIGVGVGALIMILSIMTGFLEETKKSLRGGLSDIILETDQRMFRDGRRVPHSPAPLLEAVRADPRVAGACAQLSWFGMLTQGGSRSAYATEQLADPQKGNLSGVRLFGIDVQDEYQTTELRAALARTPLLGDERVADLDDPFAPPEGYVPDGRPLASCLVGEQLASEWRLRRGSEIWITTALIDAKSGEVHPSDRRFVVAGTFRSGENEMDLQRIYLARAELSDFLGTGREYSQVLVRLKDYERDGTDVQLDFQSTLTQQGLVPRPEFVRTWEDYRRPLLGAIENERVLMAIMLSLVVVVAAFTVFAILSMMVTEKRRDIGILSALGATGPGITGLFVLIGFWDTLLGATGGAILGVLGAVYIDPFERGLSHTIGVEIFNRKVYLFDHIPAIVNPVWVGVIVLGAFVIALLFALVPAWKAGRLHPLDALRYE